MSFDLSHSFTDSLRLARAAAPSRRELRRVPVRVELDAAPSDIRLISGRTATVTVLEPTALHTPARVRQ
jgi:hypothetical protein